MYIPKQKSHKLNAYGSFEFTLAKLTEGFGRQKLVKRVTLTD